MRPPISGKSGNPQFFEERRLVTSKKRQIQVFLDAEVAEAADVPEMARSDGS
jgi:hypothetical protein